MSASLQVSPSALLEVQGLHVSLDGSTILHDVSFTVGAGEIVGLVGESGSGKSMTCRALIGLLPPAASASGRIGFADRDLMALAEGEMRRVRGRDISMIFQNPSSHLDPLMTIGSQIMEPLRHHFRQSRRDARQQAIAALQTVQINDPAQRVDAYPHELSGGMKQRGLIAAAMACRPKLLLADEPTTALDVTVQAGILNLLKTLNREEGISIILVSHDLAIVAEICDRVIVMRDGHIVEAGDTRTIMRAPRHAYTRLLIESQPGAAQPLHAPAPRAQGAHAAMIQTDDLSVAFSRPGFLPGQRHGVVRAVDGISLAIGAGETFGIVGESGSGKSTFARALMRLVEPTEGAIRFQGLDIGRLRGDALLLFRRKVQMVFQNPFDALNPRLSVLQMIAEPMIRHGIARGADARARARNLMRQVELGEDLAERRPRQLSGGQCQRVGIARALALDPEVLIADEITSALDVTIQAQILDLLRKLRRERELTIVYISHDLAVVRAFCDRIAVFHGGKLVECGDVADVLEQPRDDYTKLLIASAPAPVATQVRQRDRAGAGPGT